MRPIVLCHIHPYPPTTETINVYTHYINKMQTFWSTILKLAFILIQFGYPSNPQTILVPEPNLTLDCFKPNLAFALQEVLALSARFLPLPHTLRRCSSFPSLVLWALECRVRKKGRKGGGQREEEEEENSTSNRKQSVSVRTCFATVAMSKSLWLNPTKGYVDYVSSSWYLRRTCINKDLE